MAKRILLVLVLIFTGLSLYSNQTTAKSEAGVQVVTNHLSPNNKANGPTNLNLEEQFVIATGNEKMLMIGLTGIENFDVDSEGNIFIIQWESSENYVYKFNSSGKFIKSFVRKGQGPGELEWGGTVLVDKKNNIIAKDPSKTKFLLYDSDGKYIREIYLSGRMEIEAVLDDGNYLTSWTEITPDSISNQIWLCNSNFGKTKILAAQKTLNILTAEKMKVGDDRIIQAVSKDRIYIGSSKNGYEIRMYDLNGKLCRIIRKEYEAAKIQDDEKKAFLRLVQRSPDRGKYYFADRWPPFRYCFADDEGRLFVMTFEKKSESRESIYDVFNPEGIFITRIRLNNLSENNMTLPVKATNNHVYCLRENEDGYKELAVYKTNWK